MTDCKLSEFVCDEDGEWYIVFDWTGGSKKFICDRETQEPIMDKLLPGGKEEYLALKDSKKVVRKYLLKKK